MKKIIIILLAFLAFTSYGQADFEKIAIKENVETASTSKIVSQQPGTGELNYINATALPISNAAKSYIDSKIPATYAKVVYVNATSPNTATIFDLNNPPITNDNALKIDTANLYIGNDASTWVYNGSTYVTKSVPATSNFFIRGTTVDAGNSKTENIERSGNIKTSGSLESYEVNAGNVTANNFIKSGGTSSQFLKADGSIDSSVYATLSSPSLTGTPTAPTATVGTNTTQIATMAALQTANADNVKLTGNQTKTGDLYLNGALAVINPSNPEQVVVLENGTIKISTTDLESQGTIKASLLSTARNYELPDASGTIVITASPAFTGTPTAPTAPVGTNTTQIATTAFVQNGLSTKENVANKQNSLAIDGTGTKYPTVDAVNAGLGTKAPISGSTNYIQNQDASAQAANLWISGYMRGGLGLYFSPSNIERALVRAEVGSGDFSIFQYNSSGGFLRTALSISNSTGAATFEENVTANNFIKSGGTSSQFLKADGSVDATSYAPLASPALTGVPTAPTAAVGTNTTQIATTAFVQANAISLSANNTFTGENTFSNYTIFGAPATLKNYTVATLPEGNQGDIAYVTDALAPTYLTSVVGGGSVVCPVFYNGTSWVAH